MSMPSITISHEEALVDEVIWIKVEGLQPSQDVTVYATLAGDGSDLFESFAYYKANSIGTVDLSESSSIGGSYCEVEPMGLFWSMKPSPENRRPHSRFVMRDVERPVEVKVTVYDSHLRYESLEKNQPLTKRIVKRWYKGRGVQRIPVRHGRLRGTLFVPYGRGPFPAVVDLFGSAGGLMEFRSSLLASRGFVAFALAFIGYEDLPDTAFDVDLAYFEEAGKFLENHPAVARKRIGVIGVSVGGTLALAVATYIEGFACAASINGPVFAQYTDMMYKERIWRGLFLNLNRADVVDGAVNFSCCLEDYFDQEIPPDSKIEFDKSDKSFLFMFSEDDKAIDAKRTIELANSMVQGARCQYEIITYPGAGHLLEPPFSPHAAATHTKLINLPQRWGGNPKQHSEAQVKAWRDTLRFLTKSLAPKARL